MDTITVAEVRKPEAIGRRVVLQGWVRTRRDSKGGFSFIELNDGSCQGNVQVVAPGELPNYESQVKHLHTGASVVIEGEVKASPAKGQPTEVQASKVELLGDAPAEPYPLQKKGHTFEILRTIAHVRPRTSTFGAIARLRHRVSKTIHDFFDKPTYLTLSGQLQVEAFACSLGKVYTFGPTFRAENSDTPRHLAEFWMVVPEMAFYDLTDNMDLAEAFLKRIIKDALDKCDEDLRFFAERIHKGQLAGLANVLTTPFRRLPY